jgi:hypothetical protein
MVMTNTTRVSRALLAAAAALPLLACDMDVNNPGIIDADSFDPAGDATTVSMSAQTRFWTGYGTLVLWSAYFSGELWTGAARTETVDVGRRDVTSASIDVNVVWNAIQPPIAANELASRVLAGGANAATDVNLARTYMNAGFAVQLLAETFCQGVILAGPPLTQTQAIDSAITRFRNAVAIATAVGGSNADAVRILNAANVGLARANLQKKEYTDAATAAALVPAAFVYNAVRIDDATNRGLGNTLYATGTLGTTVVVPEPYRALGDARVPFTNANTKAQDGLLDLYRQNKYTGYATPFRIASGLEASYIVAEARLLGSNDAAPALALIAARRTAAGQPAFAGGNTTQILAELMDQRARDFWLEAKHLGDWMRNPEATPYVSPAGAPHYKVGAFGNATCLPVPDAERNANPNFPKS